MGDTKISWTNKVWNPVKGCTKISEGCLNCYAEKFARRLKAMNMSDYSDGFAVRLLPNRIEEPLNVKKPTMFFVDSMGDLFHEQAPYYYLDEVFRVIEDTPQHTYQILTKRPENMARYFSSKKVPDNVWLGVSVENEKYKDRIDILRTIDAKVHFVSFEPLIGDVGEVNLNNIQWCIVGGETGPRHREIKKEWVDSIFAQCATHDIPFFFKQWNRHKDNLLYGKVWHEYP